MIDWELQERSCWARWDVNGRKDVITLSWHREFDTKKWVCSINWSALGAQDSEMAEAFADALYQAARESEYPIYRWVIDVKYKTDGVEQTIVVIAPTREVVWDYLNKYNDVLSVLTITQDMEHLPMKGEEE